MQDNFYRLGNVTDTISGNGAYTERYDKNVKGIWYNARGENVAEPPDRRKAV